MKTLRRFIIQAARIIGNISIIDRILIAVMALLFVQFIVMLAGEPDEDVTTIDIITRSMAATIFGHFIGSNVETTSGQGDGADAIARVQPVSSTAPDVTSARIGFSSDANEPAQAASRGASVQAGRTRAKRVVRYQVWVVGGIGIISLVLIFLVRNVEALHQALELESGVATLSQLRDFAAGSIGFLVSSNRRS